MLKPTWQNRFIQQLRREGCWNESLKRLGSEMEDHHTDLVAEGIQSGLSEPEAIAFAEGRLGAAEQVARSCVQTRRCADWWGRHPRLLFGAAPLVVFILAVVGCTLLTACLGSLYGWWNRPSTISEGAWMRLTLVIPLVHFLLLTAIPLLACRLVSYYCYSWRWALAACLTLSLHGYVHTLQVDIPLLNESGRILWGYGIFRLTGHLWTALPPLLVFLQYYLSVQLGLRAPSSGVTLNSTT